MIRGYYVSKSRVFLIYESTHVTSEFRGIEPSLCQPEVTASISSDHYGDIRVLAD